MAAWLTPTTLKEDWSDAKHISPARLERLLEVAKGQLLEHGPKPLPADIETAPPANWVEAQLLQVQAIWAESKTNAGSNSGEMGIPGYQVTRTGPFQLSPGIIKLLRPFVDKVG